MSSSALAGVGEIESDHTTTLVPFEAWAFHSPYLVSLGKRVDLGGVAEALLYYDHVHVNIQRAREVDALVEAFAREGLEGDLLELFRAGILRPLHFAFFNAPVKGPEGKFMLLNIQGQEEVQPQSFQRNVLPKATLRSIRSARRRRRLLEAMGAHVVEFKADEFGVAINNARQDIFDPQRTTLIVQALVDDVYEGRGGKVPQVTADVRADQEGVRVTWSVDIAKLGAVAGDADPWGAHTPAAAAAACNRFLWAAARQGCDVFPGSPMSRLVGDKLYEAGSRAARPQAIVQSLQGEVEFPDVRAAVNAGTLSLREVLRLRPKAERFRTWLQDESDRDRNALIAYHNEVAKEAGFTRVARRTLRLLSVPGGTMAGAAAAAAVGQVSGDAAFGAPVGAIAGTGVKFLLDALSRINEGWKPVVFGKWAKDRIERYTRR